MTPIVAPVPDCCSWRWADYRAGLQTARRVDAGRLLRRRNGGLGLIADRDVQPLARRACCSCCSRSAWNCRSKNSGFRAFSPTRSLLLNPPQTPLADIVARNTIAIPEDATRWTPATIFMFKTSRCSRCPSSTRRRRNVGVLDVELYTDEISELVRKEEYDDIFQIIGVRLARLRQRSPVLTRWPTGAFPATV